MPKQMIDKAVPPSAGAEELLLELKERGEIQERFTVIWQAVMPPGEPPPDLNAFLGFLALGLRRRRTDMVAAAATREREIVDEGVLRMAVAEAHGRLAASYVDARDLYTFTYGRTAASSMGFAAVTEPRPAGLSRRVAAVLRHFRKLPAAVIPAPAARSRFAIKPSLIIGQLEAPHKGLRAATRRLAAAVRKAKLSIRVKARSYGEHAGCLSTNTLCAEMLCRMVALHDEASRIKAVKRRGGKSPLAPLC